LGVIKDHWSKFLSGWKMLGMMLEVQIGVFFARLLTELITGSESAGGKARDVALDAKLKPLAVKLELILRGDGGAALLSDLRTAGLCESAVLPEWKLLCDPTKRDRVKVDWTRATLPKIHVAPFLETRLGGGMSTNYKLEQNFSTFGAHVEDEQSAVFKEAITCHALALEPEHAERCVPDMRVPKKSKKAQEKYEKEKAARAAEGKMEELPHPDESRGQLVKRCKQLLGRIAQAREIIDTVRPELRVGSVSEFQRRRDEQWELLYKREAKAMEGVMREKRTKGTHHRTTDPFGQVRKEMLAASQAAYGAPNPAQEAGKSKRKRAPRRRCGAAADGDGDVELPSANSSLESSPAEKEPRVGEPRGSLSPSSPRVQASGRRRLHLAVTCTHGLVSVSGRGVGRKWRVRRRTVSVDWVGVKHQSG